jgi:hypothetical protein
MAPDIMAAMRRIRATEGIPVAVQLDFAAREWLKKRGIDLKAGRLRAQTRKRP